MEVLKAVKSSLTKADPVADIGLINRYAIKELAPEDVFCFSAVLCDNEVDRDLEYFPANTLRALAKMFIGKPGISDHSWRSENQVARIYRAEVEETTEKTALGEPLTKLVACAYILRTEANSTLISNIEGGIVKEVSVGCSTEKRNCSICGKPIKMDYRTWTYQCEDGHIFGETYDGKLCAGALEDPRDAYEFSFVAVPAQRGAGVTKSAQDLSDAFDLLMEADLSAERQKCLALIQKIKAMFAGQEEMALRAKILKENENFMKK